MSDQSDLINRLDTLTPQSVEAGHRVFQAHRFGEDDRGHVIRLARWAEIPLRARVIDMGCGVGEMARIISQWRDDISWTLVNLSAVQLGYCDETHRTLLCDFQDVPLMGETFDVVMFCFSIGHGELRRSMNEARRLLRKGGVLFIYDMVRTHGDNDEMWREAHYSVRERGVVEGAAWGFDLDWYMEPRDDGGHLQATLGDGAKIFEGTKPAIWRFIKRD